jgi:Flp pilus assembly protein TadB
VRGHHQHYARQMQQAQQWLAVATTGADPQLRIGDAERTQVTEALQQHYAEGRLDSDELEERLDATLAAKTQADLREITKDLPGPRSWETPDPQPRHHPHHHHHGPRFLKAPLLLLAVFGVIAITTGTPLVFFIALRILMTIAIVSLLFGFIRRRRFTHR